MNALYASLASACIAARVRMQLRREPFSTASGRSQSTPLLHAHGFLRGVLSELATIVVEKRACSSPHIWRHRGRGPHPALHGAGSQAPNGGAEECDASNAADAAASRWLATSWWLHVHRSCYSSNGQAWLSNGRNAADIIGAQLHGRYSVQTLISAG